MYRNVKQKIFHSVIITIIIIAILSVGGMFILRYQVEGESNMPFKISKISIIESVEGTESEGAGEKWSRRTRGIPFFRGLLCVLDLVKYST